MGSLALRMVCKTLSLTKFLLVKFNPFPLLSLLIYAGHRAVGVRVWPEGKVGSVFGRRL